MLPILDIMGIIAVVLVAHVLLYIVYRVAHKQIEISHEFAVHLAARAPGADCTRAIERLRRIHVRRLAVWLAACLMSFVLFCTWVIFRDTAAGLDGVTAGMAALPIALLGGVVVRAWMTRGVLPGVRLRWLSLRAAQLVLWAPMVNRKHYVPWRLTSGRQIVAEYDWPLRLKRPSKPGAAEISELVERLQGEIEAVQEPILWYGLARIVSIGEARRIVALARSALPTCMSLEDS